MKIYKTKKFNNKFLSWNGIKQKTGLDDETITSLWLCGEFPDCLPCSTFALGDGRRSEGVWLCFEINSWINAWNKGLRGDVLRELVAELKAARNAPIALLFPDNATPIDVLKLLFPECASVIDLEMKDFKKPFQDIYSDVGFNWLSKFVFVEIERCGRYWIMEIEISSLGKFHFLFTDEGIKK